MGVPSNMHNIPLVQIQPEETLATTSEVDLAPCSVTDCGEVWGMRYRRFRVVLKIPIFIGIFAFLALLCMTNVSSAVVYHQNEVISTDTTWSVDVHVISDAVSVNDNVQLTIPAGAVVKFNSGACMGVVGTLNAVGTSSNKIVFTSLKDDSYGGDTNNDGDATSPSSGNWRHIRFYGSSGNDGIGIFENAIVRYGGTPTQVMAD